MNYICQHCGAKKFPDETHFLCCHNGKVVLSQPSSFPLDLENLFKGNVWPNKNVPPTYCQLYIYDPLAAVNFRMQQRGNDLCLNDLMSRLQTIISEEDPFALAFKNMAEVEDESSSSIRLLSVRYGAPPTSREVVIVPRGHPLKTISSMSANLDPMVYPLFFPRGDAVRQFFSSLFYGKKLFQQYAVDAYVKIKGQRLAFIRNNQNKQRSKQYDALHEHVNNLGNDHNVRPGRVVVLPLTYVGSPRALKENYALAIIKKYDQTANDRPDLVTRVFKLKLNNLLNDIFKHGLLRKVVTHVQVIEFQKRGLPHVYILLHFANDDKLETAHDINNLIPTEIPDLIVNCDLYDVVKTVVILFYCR
ncbi:uncharacterized protein LOC136076147 [Hydra vulgaris]|uniref:Uncharacterized protein LOC136076147 n=1 Tax=Hydra vulgaris TaxID=6087 RepID=A0ABM4B9Z0_HYDVU